MIRVVFSPTEFQLCKHIGTLRHQVTSKLGRERKQDQSQDSEQMAINGVLTEYAVAKMLNLHFSLDCNYRKFGADLISAKGQSIDVKCASKAGGNLNAVEWSVQKPADVFVLTEIYHAHVAVVGWIPRKWFLIDDNKRDVGNGTFYSISQAQLILFDEQKYAKTL